MELPDPICCELRSVRNICERSLFCRGLGEVGTSWGEKHRKSVLLTMSALSFIAIILSAVALLSLSYDTSVVRWAPWTIGESDNDDVKAFVSLEIAILVEDGKETTFEWQRDECKDFIIGGNEVCDDCRIAARKSIPTTIVSFITTIPTLFTDLKRSVARRDLNCQKFMALATGIISTVTTLIALSTYAQECHRNLPDHIDTSDYGKVSLTYTYGSGFICLLIATFLKPVDVVVHVLIPVPKTQPPAPKDLDISFIDA